MSKRPCPSVMATWQISPRQPSTSETQKRSGRGGPQSARAGPLGSSRSCWRRKAIERWISSQRTYARAHVARACGRDGDVHEPVHARRMRLAHVALQTGGARGQPDHAQLARDLGRDAARLFETRTHRGRGPEQLDCVLHVAVRGFEALGSLRGAVWRDVESRAARPHEASAETAAAEERSEVEEVAPQPAAVGRGGEEPDVAGERAAASASREWQYAVACPMVVSPASVSA